ncbi:response regulator transcription factor [Sporomusa acidovorans]|uniref:Response regulator MprA n=1 Tax=Sporomusa acidovorans (strain ATCC 49682 / DSM 3132 / Mol) TaxID=1123286 RepID=A0ABZ3IYE5_SPOA4|nr:response regulator transcription factor [Sporomusa acidovorans]OZC17161.1 response regulator MprA [Sporomusa acidovorans DSM 3132]SDE81124.1 DNA-binding response regulator, OmpR family, contains REC and winged-helix (wHTH) domain [Sporomusa acidovorans]
MKLLLVEDEGKLVESLSHLLRKNGFVVDTALDGQAGLEMACTGVYDIIVLDRMLPYQDGVSLLKEFRSLGHDTPVIFLTAKDSPEDRAEGLDAGADDYLVKPFFSVELLARLKALTRRRGKTLSETVLTADDLILNPLRCQVIKGNEVIQLTLKESQLLELLIRNYGHVVTKEQIIQKVWGYFSEAEFTTVNLYIHYLRKKLKLSNLKTVWGVGYYLHKEKDTSLAAN